MLTWKCRTIPAPRKGWRQGVEFKILNPDVNIVENLNIDPLILCPRYRMGNYKELGMAEKELKHKVFMEQTEFTFFGSNDPDILTSPYNTGLFHPYKILEFPLVDSSVPECMTITMYFDNNKPHSEYIRFLVDNVAEAVILEFNNRIEKARNLPAIIETKFTRDEYISKGGSVFSMAEKERTVSTGRRIITE